MIARLMREIVARLPSYPPALLAAAAANALTGASLSARGLPAARGKVVAIEIRDLGLKLAFAVEEDGLVARRGPHADASISAEARDFLALALRTADPDTLFFNRRLVMQGDTELALLVKNALDALDFRALRIPGPSRVLEALASQLRALR
ncbi:MAG: ubiquinone anaerobic biosynthesis accessory factor UbiT [Betaproteobacteria bacterium]